MSENIKDPLEFATGLAEAERDNNTRLIQDKVKPLQTKDPDTGLWPEPDCEDCGEPIGDARLEATGALTCVECATKREKKGAHYARR